MQKKKTNNKDSHKNQYNRKPKRERKINETKICSSDINKIKLIRLNRKTRHIKHGHTVLCVRGKIRLGHKKEKRENTDG